jgi:hypothetical protein
MQLNLERSDYRPSGPRQRSRGLLGTATLHIGGLVVRFVSVRVTKSGRRSISFPKRRFSDDRECAVVFPPTREEHAEIERAVLKWIDQREGAKR